MRDNGRCPIWGTPVREYRRDSHDGVYVDSPRAGGRYFIAGTAQSILDDKNQRERARLTSWLVERRKLGEDYPEVKSSIVEEVERRRSLEAHERADRLLLCISSVISNNIAGTFVRPAWEDAIKPGIEEAGYEAVRIDRKEHVNKIDDEIIAELRRARFVVADFTHGDAGPRGGVYYEAGFAHGRDIPVIFSCRKDAIEKVHFDTRQYNHIVWEAEKLDEFRDRLTKRICAVIGDGPRAI